MSTVSARGVPAAEVADALGSVLLILGNVTTGLRLSPSPDTLTICQEDTAEAVRRLTVIREGLLGGAA